MKAGLSKNTNQDRKTRCRRTQALGVGVGVHDVPHTSEIHAHQTLSPTCISWIWNGSRMYMTTSHTAAAYQGVRP